MEMAVNSDLSKVHVGSLLEGNNWQYNIAKFNQTINTSD